MKKLKDEKLYIKDLGFIDIDPDYPIIGEIEVENVRINKQNNSIVINLMSENIIKEKELENLKNLFRDRFSNFSLFDMNIQYNKDIDECKDQYCEKILSSMGATMPSFQGWSMGVDIDLEKDKLDINIKNNIGYDRAKSSEFENFIKTKIKTEFDEDIMVKFNKIECDDNGYCEIRKAEEEKELLERIQRETSEMNHSSKTRPSQGGDSQSPSFGNGKKNSWKGKKRRSKKLFAEVSGEISKISEVGAYSGDVAIEGEIFDVDTRELRNGSKLYTVYLTDHTSSIPCKTFVNPDAEDEVNSVLKNGSNIKLFGFANIDQYSRELTIMIKNIEQVEKKIRMDNSPEKRVELHCHTRMSSMDGTAGASDIINRAVKWGHKAIAITDHGVVQGFPEAMDSTYGKDIKIIYGVEGYLVDDLSDIVKNVENPDNKSLNCEYTVFDIETTGFSPRNNKIIEIGAVKIRNNEIVDTFSELINPEVSIPDKIIELTGITDPMVENMPLIDDVLPRFIDFIGDSILVAHNADFDMSFIRTKLAMLDGRKINNPVLDTLALSRTMYQDLKNHRLNTIAKYLDVCLKNHHRAVDDSEATANILKKSIETLNEQGIETISDLNNYAREKFNFKQTRSNHIIILVKNLIGLKNLYKIISESHMKYFYKKPRIPKSMLNKYREGLILGTACEAGELYQSILKNDNDDIVEEIASYYDFLEIQPTGNNNFLVSKNEIKNVEGLQDINRRIVSLGKKLDKIVVATGDVHFLEPEDEVYRRILMAGQGYSDAEEQAPLYLKTTDEMLKEFSYLGEELAYEVVVHNTNKVADMIDDVKPIPDGTFPPEIEGSDEMLREMNYNKAREIYGEDLPDIVEKRLERELNSIISNGYAVMYIIAQKLVKKSNEDGYLVGSRGSVGSSFVATMSGITEVNPLPPHYICPDCKYSKFITDESVGSGVDLPDSVCPECRAELIKEGHNIPFEVFLGFEGDKEPDIDLNFAGEYQANAHKYTEELFGEGYVFRAGTIGTIAEKTAYGFVKKYFESREEFVNNAEINRLVKGCTGIKRTSGQHPGGVMVVPNYKDIYDFTPIQYPADDAESGVITTHFDYNAISGRILKLDILGHDAPSIIRMLEDFTGVDSDSISLDDERTKQIFLGTEVLGITPEQIDSEVGTYGIPEFGTKFVRQMLEDTRPTTFSELVRISGLSHGTDVWLNNAQDLVRNGTATLSEVICTRDDIMNYLIHANLENKHAFQIMEKVRKGKGITDEDEQAMIDNNVPDWYIDSCKKIKYMFPKAHAVAYVMMSFRIAYFKVNHPEAFYATYFSTKVADFEAELILKGEETVRSKIKELDALGNDISTKEKNLRTVLEVCLEMYTRGYKFERVDLYKSDSDKFKIGENGIIPPLKSLEGVGEGVARSIAEVRDEGKFISVEDLVKRSRASKTVVEALRLHGCLAGLQETNQIDLFSIF